MLLRSNAKAHEGLGDVVIRERAGARGVWLRRLDRVNDPAEIGSHRAMACEATRR